MLTPCEVRAAQDEGFTLVELLVSIVLLGVVGAVVTAGIVTAMKTTRQDELRGDGSAKLRIAVERVSQDVRAADPLRIALPQGLVVDEDRIGKCVRSSYQVASGLLQTQRTTYDSMATCAATPVTALPTSGWTTLLTQVDAVSTFIYYNDNSSSGTAVVPTPATIPALTRVGVYLQQNQREKRGPVSLSVAIDLRNAR